MRLSLYNTAMSKGGGFTLIELLVVISIISLILSIVLSTVNSARSKAQVATFAQDIMSLRKALLLYKESNNGNVPPPTVFPAGTLSTPFQCFDQQGFAFLDECLQPLLTQKLISKIPHVSGWPANANIYEGPKYTMTEYKPNVYGWGGVDYEFSCTPMATAEWYKGKLPGIIRIVSTETLPFSKGFTQCASGASGCTNYPATGFSGGVTYTNYCISLGY